MKICEFLSELHEHMASTSCPEILQMCVEFCIHWCNNREQIEDSKIYEKLPKPYAIAIEEWLENKIYYRDTEADTEQ